MSMQRITISLPKYIYNNLIQQIPVRGVSRFVTQAIDKELIRFDVSPIKEFIEFKKRLPKKTRLSILKAIKKGRK